MTCSTRTACAIAALTLLATLSGCDVYDSQLLQAAATAPRADAGEAYIERCGDGQLDSDELCDMGIAEGEAGACPRDCPSDDPCTPQVLIGEACQRACAVLHIQLAINDDGCCPPGIGPLDDSDCGSCGDGIIGPTETCEPAASCITQDRCGTVAACLHGIFRGDPALCTSACDLVPVEICKNDDGCCPPTCNTGNDNDCSATCGNGIVEPQNHETCEPGSAMSPCPANCDDGIACTTDVPSGTAQQCNLTCSHIGVTNAVSGDGCCPAGANSVSDSDCQPVCGNHIVEMGEACDPCPSDCDDEDACTKDTRLGSGCSVTCGHTPITAAAGGDGCCPAGANSLNDSDCPVVCGNGVREGAEACDGGGRCGVNCDVVLPSSLVHRYSFDGSGTTVSDSVGTAHGTVVNTTLSGGGVFTVAGGSSNQYADLPNGIISSLTDITVEVWATWQGGSSSHRYFDFGINSAGEGANSGTGTEYFYLNPQHSSGDVMVAMNFTPAGGDYSVADYQVVGTTPSIGSRHHFVVTFHDPGASSSKTLVLYIDGAQQNSLSVPASVSGTNNRLSSLDDRNVWIGRSNYSAATFAGTVDEFRIYNAALSASQVTASFNAGPNP